MAMHANWRATLISPEMPIREAMVRLTTTGQRILLVVDGEERLLGTVTDGDIRRAILTNIPIDHGIAAIMCHTPRTIEASTSRAVAEATIRRTGIQALPVLEPGGPRVVGLLRVEDIVAGQGDRPNEVLVLAGGLGQRLRPLTETVPKPMLPVGGRPILETIIEELASHGLRNITLAVNYKAEVIKHHFGDGSRLGVRIAYVEENDKLGTAGALGLLDRPLRHPLLVMNGDLLTKVDFTHLLDYHDSQDVDATMCVRPFDMEVPYGVVQFDGKMVRGVVEKPVTRFMINAGIYVLDPAVPPRVPAGVAKDMPELLAEMIAAGQKVVGFPIHEYWIDIGRMAQFDQATADYDDIFARP